MSRDALIRTETAQQAMHRWPSTVLWVLFALTGGAAAVHGFDNYFELGMSGAKTLTDDMAVAELAGGALTTLVFGGLLCWRIAYWNGYITHEIDSEELV